MQWCCDGCIAQWFHEERKIKGGIVGEEDQGIVVYWGQHDLMDTVVLTGEDSEVWCA